MRNIEDLDHYDLLELPRGADGTQVEKAYRRLSAAYAPDSLAIYSILDASEAECIRERIEQAYGVLADEEQRHHYDVFLVQGIPPGSEVDEEEPVDEPEPVVAGASVPDEEEEPAAADPERFLPPFSASPDAEETDYNGDGLRRARLSRGLEIDQLASITKISPNYLRCIEEERFDELPAVVYVRGFVAASARALGLDPDEAVRRYVALFEAARSGPRRSRFLGRK